MCRSNDEVFQYLVESLPILKYVDGDIHVLCFVRRARKHPEVLADIPVDMLISTRTMYTPAIDMKKADGT